MQVVIVGCGKTGIKLARKLSNLNNDVTIIESDKEVANRVSKEFDGKIINGLEFDKNILENAGVMQADVVVVTTESDNKNIIVAQVLNKIFEIKNIILSLQNPALAQIYEDSCLEIICPTNIISEKIMDIMNKQEE